MFYANMVIEQKAKEVSIFIEGKSYILTPTLLNEILEVPNKGDYITLT